MLGNLVVLACVVIGGISAVLDDLVDKVPGYGDEFKTKVYSGYLNTAEQSRKMHYIFVQSVKGTNNSDPLTLWLNGGPGCSSYIGFLQQIGPYFLQQGKNYTKGDKLTPNPYSWHKVSNLLFLQSPAGVGYSTNTNTSFKYNDVSTMQDNFHALLDFFQKFWEYKKVGFWIAGQSYAGKYIPDLAYRIDFYNLDPNTPPERKIKLYGLFIGNGVIDFRDDSLWKSTIEYSINHDLVDPQTLPYWTSACTHDEQSAGCQFFYKKFEQTMQDINQFNIYSYCYYNDSFMAEGGEKRQFLSQEAILRVVGRNSGEFGEGVRSGKSRFNGATCMYFDGLYQYFNTHYKEFHAKLKQSETIKWNGPCAQQITTKYTIDPSGSTHQLQYLFNRLREFYVVLYNGDWDTVVPYTDTLKNLQKLKMQPFVFTPIMLNDQHIGFNTLMSGINFITVKGASHQVPQSKRPEIYHIYEALITSYSDGEGKAKKELVI